MSNLTATLHTSRGPVEINLYDERAPRTVENFVGLATGTDETDVTPGPGTGAWVDPNSGDVRTDPLYENVEFHRVIPDFMVQTGDPTGTGRGGPGYEFDDEFHPELRHDQAGVVSMANSGPNTNGSQFFITLAAQPHLDERHSVFGKVLDGFSVIETIGTVETNGDDRPRQEIYLESVDINQ